MLLNTAISLINYLKDKNMVKKEIKKYAKSFGKKEKVLNYTATHINSHARRKSERLWP